MYCCAGVATLVEVLLEGPNPASLFSRSETGHTLRRQNDFKEHFFNMDLQYNRCLRHWCR